MTYNSLQFFPFFAIFLILYLLMPRVKLRQIVILIGNIFYMLAAGKGMLFVLAATSLVVYAAARAIDHIYSGYEREKEGLTPKEGAALFAGYKKRAKKYLISPLSSRQVKYLK